MLYRKMMENAHMEQKPSASPMVRTFLGPCKGSAKDVLAPGLKSSKASSHSVHPKVNWVPPPVSLVVAKVDQVPNGS